MAYTESHQSLARHPKTLRLMRRLGTSRAETIGHLHLFWWWCLDYAPDGDLTPFDNEEIAIALEWEGDADALVQALTDAGFIEIAFDGRARVFGWKSLIRPHWSRPSGGLWSAIRSRVFERDDYTCQYCGRRAVRLECDHVLPVSKGGSSDEGNLVTACFECNRSKGSQLIEEWVR